jgi:UPF0755 protein
MSRKKSGKVKIILAVVIVLIIGIVAYLGYTVVSNDINGNEKNSSEYTLVINSSDFEYEVAQKLYNNKVVLLDSVWTTWLDKHYPNFTYTNGEYYLTTDMSYEEIVQKLKNPDISHKSVKVCVPEGYNVFEISKVLEENNVCSADDFLEACKNADDYDYQWLKDFPDNDLIAYQLEGFLFPATYDLAENTDAYQVVDEMLGAFDDRISDDMTEFCTANDMSLYELITLASIVQEEALGADSAGNIASVFLNRLQQNPNAKLQSDVTYYYAVKLRDEYGFSQEVYDAYYTYRCEGLPAGPVCNAGLEIINATINHPDTDYIYFFSDLNQEFHFAKDYQTFEQLKEEYPWK